MKVYISCSSKKVTKKLMLEIFKDKGKAHKFYPPPYIEDRNKVIEHIKSQLLDQGAEEKDIEITKDKIAIGNQYWLLPKHSNKGEIVKVEVRSSDLITKGKKGNVYSKITEWQVVNNKDDIFLQHKAGAKLYPVE